MKRALLVVFAALDHLDRALRTLDALDADPGVGTRAELALLAASCARWAGDPHRGIDLVRLGIDRFAPRDQSLAWERIGWLSREVGLRAEAAEAYRRAIDSAEPGAPEHVQALAGHAALLMTGFAFADAGPVAERGLALTGPDPSPARASLLCTLGVIRALDGDATSGLELLEASRDVALACASEPDVWRYVGNATFVLQNVGRTDDAVGLGLDAVARARRTGILRSLAVLPTVANVVTGLARLGRWDEALGLVAEARDEQPGGQAAAVLSLAAAEIEVLRGRAERARDHLTAGRAAAGTAADLGAHASRIEAEAAIWAGSTDAARAAIDAAARRAGTDDAEVLLAVARTGLRIEADQANPDPARVHRYEDLAPSADDAALEPARLACSAEAARAASADSATQWRAVASAWDALGDRFPSGYAYLRAAEAALRDGDRRGAARLLGAASAVAEALGAAVLADAVSAVGRRGRLSVGAAGPATSGVPPAAAAVGLTPREVDVLGQLLDGRTDRQIARSFGISERTVGVHVSNVLAKLGVSSRAQAAATAHRTGLLSGAQPADRVAR